MNLIESNICPKDILTFEAFENAITFVNAASNVGLTEQYEYYSYVDVTYYSFSDIKLCRPIILSCQPDVGYVSEAVE
jgi:hypothetical protein